jgi:hypothetical protein
MSCQVKCPHYSTLIVISPTQSQFWPNAVPNAVANRIRRLGRQCRRRRRPTIFLGSDESRATRGSPSFDGRNQQALNKNVHSFIHSFRMPSELINPSPPPRPNNNNNNNNRRQALSPISYKLSLSLSLSLDHSHLISYYYYSYSRCTNHIHILLEMRSLE